MQSRSSAKKTSDPNEPTDEARNRLLEEAIHKREKLAESSLEMATMFMQRGKMDIARRRLREIVAEFDGSAAASEAKAMLKTPKR
jgi:TolA-binding protein